MPACCEFDSRGDSQEAKINGEQPHGHRSVAPLRKARRDVPGDGPNGSQNHLTMRFDAAAQLGVGQNTLPAQFEADARLLVSTKRQGQVEHIVGVDPDRTGLQRIEIAVRAIDILGPDARPQSKARLVGDGDRFQLGSYGPECSQPFCGVKRWLALLS
jgi:hypothetical protein